MVHGRAAPCHLVLSVWVLVAVTGPPAVAAVGVDECATNSVCGAKGQTCKDPDLSAAGNWVCACTGSSTGADVPQATATCTFTDECAANFVFCTAQGHTCEDPDAAVTGDWRCVCPSPKRTVTPGSMTVVAVCDLDECLYQGNYQTCHEAGQECKDGNTAITSTGDWTCSCVSGTGMPKVAAPAVCVEDGECVVNAAVCQAQGQSCSDPDTSIVGDWVCKCVTPETGADSKGGPATCIVDECTATCPTCAKDTCAKTSSVCRDANTAASSRGDWRCVLDECVANAAKCTGGQTCTDADDSPTATGDWTCVCPSPQVGSATAGPATCTLDECTMGATKGLCQKFGQLCSDPVKTPASLSDFVCSCVFPLGGTAVAAKATCTGAGSCTADAVATCEAAGQLCTHTAAGFDCVCLPPATGPPGIKAVAVCVLDECAVACSTCADRGDGNGNRCKPASPCKDPDTSGLSVSDWYCEVDECLTKGTVCTNAGQTCKDPDLQKLNTWQCLCKAPASGAQITGTAACTEDECTANKGKCTGQTCTDPDVSKTGDWLCSCVAPLSGRKTGGPATCELDECVANAATCTAAGQTCEDPNKDAAATGDWTCNCIAPATGTPATAGAATCMQTGECTANEATCTAAKQSCNDPDPSTDGDWQCVCIAPMSGTGMQGVATCELDECVANAQTCLKASQTCEDPDRKVTGDWLCQCKAPFTGSGQQAAAACEVDECPQNSVICSAAGQTCRDADLKALNTWECVCVPPSKGSGTGAVASCTLDECEAKKGVCTAAGQTCNDPDKAVAAAGDWTCTCVAPATGMATAAAATCMEMGECVANGAVCTNAGQSCSDPDPSAMGDWTCNCLAPKGGQNTMGPAMCTLDECNGNTVCPSGTQACNDPDTAVDADWVCACVAPLSGSATGGAATCTLDECSQTGVSCPMGQSCNDPDTAPGSTNDWTCVCAAPQSGQATGGPATCILDECLSNNATCTASGQVCKDGNTDPTVTGDWSCNCVPPAQGIPATASAAMCVVPDECDSNAVCSTAGQTCNDPDPSVNDDWVCVCTAPFAGVGKQAPAICTHDECVSNTTLCAAAQTCADVNQTTTGDWTCTCDAPATGSAIAGNATCELDECVANAATCTAAGQTCEDPNKDAAATGDWTCNCIAPATGPPVTAGAATCMQTGECTANEATCTAAKQSCNDPDPSTDGDWQCVCIAPMSGTGMQGVATCELDECVPQGSKCTTGQTCKDANQTVSDDWICECDAPLTGNRTGGPATCELDECVANAATCTAAGQTCEDPNKDAAATGDWTCNCIAPATGTPATAGAATCMQTGECTANEATCTAAKQSCNDPDPSTDGDWQCVCIAPMSGTGMQGVATCELDECVPQGSKCTTGQTCKDANQTVSDDWICECDAPLTGNRTGGPATCELDECVANAATCTAAGQTCEDPDVAATGDWTCNCIAPATGTPVTAGAAMCMQTGECTANEATCTAAKQSCNDPDPSTDGDWQCVCIAPMSGTGMQGVATCELDECVEKGNVCRERGQMCRDPARTSTSLNDWECSCVGSGVGSAVAGPASCTWSSGCAYADNWNTCASKGQACGLVPHSAMTDFMCYCINSSSTHAFNDFVKDCGAAPGPAGQNCSSATAEACASEGCEWRNHTQKCAVPYCSGVDSCVDDPICEAAAGAPCTRTRCGRRETRGSCESGDGCVWSAGGSAKLPSRGAEAPYELSPAFCADAPAAAPEKSSTGFLIVVLCVGAAVCLCLIAAVVYFLRRGKEADNSGGGQGFENTPFMGGAERSMQDSWGSPPPPPPPPPQMQLLPAPVLDHEVSLVHVAQPPEVQPQLQLPELTPEPAPAIPDHVVYIEEGEESGLVCTDEAAGKVWVEDVHPDSPCWQAGVPCGLLTAIDGQPVTRPSDVGALMAVARARAQRLGSSTAEVRLQVDGTQKLPPALAAFSHASREVGDRLSQRPDAATAQGQLDTLRRSAREKERMLKERALVELDARSSGLYSPAASGRGRNLGASFGVSDTSTMSMGRGAGGGHPLDQSRHLQSVGGSDTVHYVDGDGSHVLHLQL